MLHKQVCMLHKLFVPLFWICCLDFKFTKSVLRKFTEPDPRDDLSGLDVARKIVILAREV